MKSTLRAPDGSSSTLKEVGHNYCLTPPDVISRALFFQAPEPLLPNYGAGGLRPYAEDVGMMVYFNGKERTLTEYVELT